MLECPARRSALMARLRRGCHVPGGVASADVAGVLAVGDGAYVVQLVLDFSLAADHGGERSGLIRSALRLVRPSTAMAARSDPSRPVT